MVNRRRRVSKDAIKVYVAIALSNLRKTPGVVEA